jgi:hypothetical protein
MEKNQIIAYTIILHKIRKELKLTLMEYCVADCIYHLSNNPSSKILGWCYAPKGFIADFLETSSQTIFSIIDKLIEKKLLEKDEATKHLRTTSLWYDKVVLPRSKKEYKETLYPIKKLDSKSIKKLDNDYKETLYNNNNIVIDNNNIILHSEQSSPGKEVNELIDLFKEVNPSYQRLFAYKSQWASVERLLVQYGREKLEEIIKFLPKNNDTDYAPIIVTPFELEMKMGKLLAFWKKNNKSKIQVL